MSTSQSDATKLADSYLDRLQKGTFKSEAQMRAAILNNVVNSKYGRTDNDTVNYIWKRIDEVLYPNNKPC